MNTVYPQSEVGLLQIIGGGGGRGASINTVFIGCQNIIVFTS